MKTLKQTLIGILLISALFVSAGDSKKNEYVGIEKISNMKKYNPKAVWHKVKCTYCHGTGSIVKCKYDAKRNRTYKWMVPCPYCHGKGTRGMSKK